MPLAEHWQDLAPQKPKTGKFPVIYDRRVAASLVGTMAGAINGAAISRGTSFLKEQPWQTSHQQRPLFCR